MGSSPAERTTTSYKINILFILWRNFGVIHIFKGNSLFTKFLKLICGKTFIFSLRHQKTKDSPVLNNQELNNKDNSDQLNDKCLCNAKDGEFRPFSIQLNKDDELKEEIKEKISELKSVYRLSIETRNFEITNLIHRNNFFMLFQGVLLAAVFSNQASKPYVEFCICFMGILISWHQIKVAAGAKYWQEWWEMRTSDIERQLKQTMQQTTGNKGGFISLFDFEDIKSKELYEFKVKKSTIKSKSANRLFAPLDKCVKKLIISKYSVSRVPISSGIILLITWLVLFLGTLGLAESVMKTSSKYEFCNLECNGKSDIPAMLKEGLTDFKLVNGHYFTDNEDPPTQLIFNQYNQEKPR
ncbi:hypothetical protein [Acinetobacter sp. 226]|uniref:RipA family octameric membrane protein n=1 Tax=Acinetobacter sp. 226 TaxID=3114699 RepID=UPI003A8668EE